MISGIRYSHRPARRLKRVSGYHVEFIEPPKIDDPYGVGGLKHNYPLDCSFCIKFRFKYSPSLPNSLFINNPISSKSPPCYNLVIFRPIN